jgi:hypothetical protein
MTLSQDDIVVSFRGGIMSLRSSRNLKVNILLKALNFLMDWEPFVSAEATIVPKNINNYIALI